MAENKMEKMEFFGEEMLPAGVQVPVDGPAPVKAEPADFGDGDSDVGVQAPAPGDGEPAREKRGRGRPPVITGDPSKTVSVKGIPKRMLTIAKQRFPGDVTQVDAFVAYLVCNCPDFAADRDLRKLGLTARQKALVDASDTSEYMSMMKQLSAMGRKLDKANRQISMLTGMLMMLLYDHTGNRVDNKQMTTTRIMGQDFQAWDGGKFMEFRDAMMHAFARFTTGTAELDGMFFGNTPRGAGGTGGTGSK